MTAASSIISFVTCSLDRASAQSAPGKSVAPTPSREQVVRKSRRSSIGGEGRKWNLESRTRTPDVQPATHIVYFVVLLSTLYFPLSMSSESRYSAVDVARDVEQAVGRIEPYVRETPLEESATLSRETGGRVFLKLESTQVSGSFKARGAFNKLLSLTPAERVAGSVTA